MERPGIPRADWRHIGGIPLGRKSDRSSTIKAIGARPRLAVTETRREKATGGEARANPAVTKSGAETRISAGETKFCVVAQVRGVVYLP